MNDGYKCIRCGKPAQLHYNEINNGLKQEIHYCSECAVVMGVGNLAGSTLSTLSQLYKYGNEYEELQAPIEKKCKCGMTYKCLMENNLFGCSECYKVFADVVERYVRQFSGHENKSNIRMFYGEGTSKEYPRNSFRILLPIVDDSPPMFSPIHYNLYNNASDAEVTSTNAESSNNGTDASVKIELSNKKMLDKLRIELEQAVAERRFVDCDRIDKQIRQIEEGTHE